APARVSRANPGAGGGCRLACRRPQARAAAGRRPLPGFGGCRGRQFASSREPQELCSQPENYGEMPLALLAQTGNNGEIRTPQLTCGEQNRNIVTLRAECTDVLR